MWYEEIGKHIGEIHNLGGAVILSCTDQFGEADLSNQEALLATESAHPDYVTGADPFVFPCRYTFTPFTIVVDLPSGTILGKDSEEAVLSMPDILDLLDQVKEKR